VAFVVPPVEVVMYVPVAVVITIVVMVGTGNAADSEQERACAQGHHQPGNS